MHSITVPNYTGAWTMSCQEIDDILDDAPFNEHCGLPQLFLNRSIAACLSETEHVCELASQENAAAGDMPLILMKKRSERRKHCALAVVRRSLKFTTRRRPLPGGTGRPKFNQLEMVTTCTYRPSLVKIDARNFELSR